MNNKEASFTGKLAVVYNNYLSVLGGGERSTFAYAKALIDLGFKVEILSLNDVPSASQVVRCFGQEFSGIDARKISSQDAYRLSNSKSLSLFVNHTYMSLADNPAQIGVYAQMFPYQVLKRTQNPKEIESINSYNIMTCNSSFTKKHTNRRWDYAPERTYVLNPPIGAQFIDLSRNLERQMPPKKKQIVNLGRFSPEPHNKNQLVIIDAFLEAISTFPSLKDWTLVLVGNVGLSDACKKYLIACAESAERSNRRVIIKNDLPIKGLSDLLVESFGYVHATGAFLSEDLYPEKCEHFGLAIAEAMAHGCVPLVYSKGGIFDVLDAAHGCITYSTRKELIEGFLEMAMRYNTKEGEVMQLRNLAAVQKLSFDSFTNKLRSLLDLEFMRLRRNSENYG
jgi:glycosyltransferase involved in cell wall biosynthesis